MAVIKFHSIVHHRYFCWINAIMVADFIFGVLAHCQYLVCSDKSFSLNIIDVLVIVASSPVKLCGMDMNNQWLSRFLFCGQPCLIGHPIVAVDNIKILCLGNEPGL